MDIVETPESVLNALLFDAPTLRPAAPVEQVDPRLDASLHPQTHIDCSPLHVMLHRWTEAVMAGDEERRRPLVAAEAPCRPPPPL